MRKAEHNYKAARQLRREMTLPEGLIWRELKARKSGLKFRRQHPVGAYVLDFYCAKAKMGFEIDGSGHSMGDTPQHDIKRDAWLLKHGIRIVRIPASEVLADPLAVAEAIVKLASGQ